MLKNKFLLIVALALLLFSSCGIFHKGCGCPHFGAVKKMQKFTDEQMC